MFNVWKNIIQNLNIKEWKLLELQITQTRHPLSILDGKMSKFNSPKIRKCLSDLHKKERHMFNVWTIIMQSLDIKEWKLLELQITQTRNHLSISNKKCLSSRPHKNEKNIHEMCIKYKVHIFNVWTIIIQSLKIKEWILLELQIIQTRHPLSISDEKMSKFNTPKKWKKIWKVHKIGDAHFQCVNNH